MATLRRWPAVLTIALTALTVAAQNCHAGTYVSDPTYSVTGYDVHIGTRHYTGECEMTLDETLQVSLIIMVGAEASSSDLDEFEDPIYDPDALQCRWQWSTQEELPPPVDYGGGGTTYSYHPDEGGQYYLHWWVRDTGMHDDGSGNLTYYQTANDPPCESDPSQSGACWDHHGVIPVKVYHAKIEQENMIGLDPLYECYIPVNDNDSNSNDIVDRFDTSIGDSDIKPVDFTGIGPATGRLALVPLRTLSEDVRVWESQGKGTKYEGVIEGLPPGIRRYWLEGIIGEIGSDAFPAAGMRLDFAFGNHATGVVHCKSITVYPGGIDMDIGPFFYWTGDSNDDTAECGNSILYPPYGSIVELNDDDRDSDGQLDREEPIDSAPEPLGPLGSPGVCLACSFHKCGVDHMHISVESGQSKVRFWHAGPMGTDFDLPSDPDFGCGALLTLEGVQPSDAPGDVVVKASVQLPGPAQYVAEDRARVTVAKVDVAIDDQGEAREEVDPRPVARNDDDDNTNSMCDFNEIEPLDDVDDELVRANGTVMPVGLPGQWRWSTGRPTTDLWTTQTKEDYACDGYAPLPTTPFWIEGVNAGAAEIQLLYDPFEIGVGGPYGDPQLYLDLSITDRAKVDVIDPEIDLEGLDDCIELTQGGFLPLNDNDNDGVDGEDRTYNGPTTQPDPDLAQIELSFGGPCDAGDPREMQLSAPSGGERIRVWADRNKSAEIMLPHTFSFDSDMVFSNGRYAKNLFVEGYMASSTMNDVELKVTYTRDSISFIDRVKLTVVDVVIDAPAVGVDKAVLISKTPGMGDDYPDADLQTEDGVMRIEAHTVPRMRDLPVYFSSWDPDDESPYEPDEDPDDNADGPGTIHAVPGYIYEGQPGQTLKVYSDPNGDIKVKLHITSHCSGDNYYVTARAITPPDRTESRSATMVAWKRVYLEIDNMLRYPNEYYQSCYDPSSDVIGTAAYGANSIAVTNTSNFTPGDEVVVFDSAYPQGEHHFVVGVGQDSITLYTLLSRSYVGGYGSGGRGAAVAKASAMPYTYALTSRLKEAYGDIADPTGAAAAGCFVDFRETPAGGTTVPFEACITSTSSTISIDDFTRVWFDHVGQANTFHLVAIYSFDNRTIHGLSNDVPNCSYVSFRGAQSETQKEAQMADTAAHEIGHQFFWKTGADEAHANVPCWDGSVEEQEYCVMDVASGQTHFFTTPCHFCWAGDNHIGLTRNAGDPR